jgi:hypothetical protein
MSILGTAAVAAAIAFTAPVAAPADHALDSADTSVTTSTERTVHVGTYHLSGLWSDARVDAKGCPKEAPYLSGHEFHEGSGYLIPRGVAIGNSRGVLLAMNIVENGKPATAISGGKIVNWSGYSTDVTVTLHCTDTKP